MSEETLTAAEMLALQSAITNDDLMSAMNKLFLAEEKWCMGTMQQVALAPQPDTNQMIQNAARARAFHEWLYVLKKNAEKMRPKPATERRP